MQQPNNARQPIHARILSSCVLVDGSIGLVVQPLNKDGTDRKGRAGEPKLITNLDHGVITYMAGAKQH